MEEGLRAKCRWPVLWPLSAVVLCALCAVAGSIRVAEASEATKTAEATEAGGPADPVFRSAIYLLRQSTAPQRSGDHVRLLQALRHLRDPALRPLFQRLSQSDEPSLRLQGILGLAELSDDGQLPLQHLAELDDPGLQAHLIGAAIDNDLLTTEQIKQVLAWPDLDGGVVLLLAGQLLEVGKLTDPAPLHAALDADRLGRRALAALLLVQLGDSAGLEALRAVDQSPDRLRDAIRVQLLRTALRQKLHRTAGWAYAVSMEASLDSELAGLALRTAMRFGHPRATQRWREAYEAAKEAEDLPHRIEVALLALEVAPWSEASLFSPLLDDEDVLIRQIGQTAQAVAEGRPDIPEQVVALVRMQHRPSLAWVLDYARDEAELDEAQLILLGLLEAYEPETSPPAAVTRATELLYDKDPGVAATLLRPMLSDPATDPSLTRAILLGLIQVPGPTPGAVVAGLDPFDQRENDHLALLLRARDTGPMNETQVQDLALLVRGGGSLPPMLRLQAAWSWLKRNQQTHAALTRVLEEI